MLIPCNIIATVSDDGGNINSYLPMMSLIVYEGTILTAYYMQVTEEYFFLLVCRNPAPVLLTSSLRIGLTAGEAYYLRICDLIAMLSTRRTAERAESSASHNRIQ